MRFTDDGQTSNQYGFYQPERPKPKPAPEQKSSPAHMDTPAQPSTPPVSQGHPPGVRMTPDQVDLNKREKEERNAKDVPLKEKVEKKIQGAEISAPSKKPAPTGKEKQCSHPESEIIQPCSGIAICTACYE